MARLSNVQPSGLFPSGPRRPTFREPHPIRAATVVIGAVMTLAWQFLVAGFASSLRDLFWRTVFAVAAAVAVALILARAGDRGAAVGIGFAASVGGCVAALIVTVRWVTTGWPLW
jgi:hypothetical protein